MTMRFQTRAVIQCHDLARVSNVLKAMLLDLTIDIVCAGKRMTLVGFGPGDVSMNQVDSTVLTFEERSDGVFVEADGIFDGSHLGESLGQEAQIRSKLERVFIAVQQLIDSEETGSRNTTFKMQDATEALPARAELAVVEPLPVGGSSEAVPRLVYASLLDNARADRASGPTQPSHKQSTIFATAVIGCIMVTVGIIAKHGLSHQNSVKSHGAQTPQSVTQPVRADVQATASNAVARTDVLSSKPVASSISSTAATQFSDASSDPITWLSHWERAMRTRDAAEQSSFYADQVDRYEGEKRVSNADVKEMKRRAIAERKGLWVVKVEGVVIQKQSKDAVELQLVKHFIYQPAFQHASEQFVKTELTLKRIKSKWKIVSEEDLEESPNPLA